MTMSVKKFENHILESCESTNDLALQMAAEGADNFTFVAARTQTRGRGRDGRKWISPVGQLYVSYVIRTLGKNMGLLPLMCGVSLVEILIDAGVITDSIKLKWP